MSAVAAGQGLMLYLEIISKKSLFAVIYPTESKKELKKIRYQLED